MNRRRFITGLLTAPMIVRATSLDALHFPRTLRIEGKFIDVTEPLNASRYDRVIIKGCGIATNENSSLFVRGCERIDLINNLIATDYRRLGESPPRTVLNTLIDHMEVYWPNRHSYENFRNLPDYRPAFPTPALTSSA